MKRYKQLFNEDLEHWIDIKFSDIEKLEEGLRLSDLKKHSGISNLTTKFKNIRSKKVGPGNKSSKLVQMKVNKSKGYITFIFSSTPTNKDEILITNPKNNFKPYKKEYSAYTEMVRIKDIFGLLKTKPGFTSYQDLTIEDIKDVLRGADVSVFCDCFSYHWQGFNYYSSLFDASVFPTNIPPTDKTGPNGKVIGWKSRHNAGDSIVCKHLSMILSQSNLFVNNMASMIYKYLQGQKTT